MNLKRLSILLLLIATISCTSNKIDSKKATQILQLDSLFSYSYQKGLFNGAVLITKNDEIIYKKAFGYENKQTKQKIDENSVFYVASLSKQFTAMAIMILKEKGKLSFNSKIKEFFPEYPDRLKEITVKQLLNHTSGILDNEYYKLVNPNNKQVIELLLKDESTKANAGEFFRYSNSGYVLLATIVEKISKMPMDEFFKNEIFNPLQMENSTAKREEVLNLNNLVSGYGITGEEATYKSSVIGPSGIYATLNDLQKWNKGLNNFTLVSKETLQLAFTNGIVSDGEIVIKMDGEDMGYGFGWITSNKNNKKYVNHDGFVEGFRTLIKKNLTDGYDYILLTNHGVKLAMTEMKTAIDLILEESKYQQPKMPVINQILAKIEAKDFSAIYEEVYHNIIKKKLDFNEGSLNSIGYRYLGENKFKEAIAIFKLNTKLNPQSANAFDSLAEGYFKNKQFDLSKSNYQKSLVLDATNTNAKIMLYKIVKM